MNDGEALLTAILASPDEDTPRLVYADWLQEHGQDDRAEFIRVQIELARLPDCEFKEDGKRCDQTFRPHSISCRACEGRRRERDLLGTNRADWFQVGTMRPWSNSRDDVAWATGGGAAGSFYLGGKVRRGFVAAITGSADMWLAHADALYWHPKQTLKCPEPKPHSVYFQRPEHDTNCYGGCKGTGSITRPCPLTAHPITNVTLTDEPNERDFGTIHEIDWQTRKVKYFRWPKIEFTLPPTPEPPRIPLSNWRCNYRERSEEPVESIHRGYALGQGVRHLDLEIRLPGAAHAFRELLGQQFGPLTATDDSGGRWVCEAILMNATTDAGRRELTTILTARSVAYPILVSLD